MGDRLRLQLHFLAFILLLLPLAAQASESRLWIVQSARGGDLSDCPKRASNAIATKSPDARLMTSDAVILFPSMKIPLRGEGGRDEDLEDVTDNCFALTVNGLTVVSGAILRPHSARLLRFPVLQLLTFKQGEGVRFHLTPAFPEEYSTISKEKWWNSVDKLQVKTMDKDFKAGALARLTRYIGTYRYDEVLADTDVSATLNRMMSPKEKSVLRENMQVMSPIAFSGTHLVLKGNKPHAGGSDEAVVAISLEDGALHAAVMHNGKVIQYKDKHNTESTPDAIHDFVQESERIIKGWKELK
jgi:hypothetical protein